MEPKTFEKKDWVGISYNTYMPPLSKANEGDFVKDCTGEYLIPNEILKDGKGLVIYIGSHDTILEKFNLNIVEACSGAYLEATAADGKPYHAFVFMFDIDTRIDNIYFQHLKVTSIISSCFNTASGYLRSNDLKISSISVVLCDYWQELLDNDLIVPHKSIWELTNYVIKEFITEVGMNSFLLTSVSADGNVPSVIFYSVGHSEEATIDFINIGKEMYFHNFYNDNDEDDDDEDDEEEEEDEEEDDKMTVLDIEQFKKDINPDIMVDALKAHGVDREDIDKYPFVVNMLVDAVKKDAFSWELWGIITENLEKAFDEENTEEEVKPVSSKGKDVAFTHDDLLNIFKLSEKKPEEDDDDDVMVYDIFENNFSPKRRKH